MYPAVLPLKTQYQIGDEILQDRLKTLLPALMKECGVNLWLVICREYNEDPVFKTLVPALVKNAARMSCLAFAMEKGRLRAINLGRPNPRLAPYYEQGYDPKTEDQWDAIAAVINRYGGTAAVNFSEDCAMADGLSSVLYNELKAHLPKDAMLVSAENLAVRWLETRSVRELEWYQEIYAVAMGILEDAYSRNVIHPGVTTTTDVENYIMQRINSLGLGAWFSPDVDLQRRGSSEPRMTEAVIDGGDLLHTDMGISYLGLYTDTQRLAYVLREGETEIPDGIRRGFERGLRFQDIVGEQFVENRSGNEILRLSLNKGRAENLRPMVYSHPVGVYGHAAGPCIGLFDNQHSVPGSGENRLHDNTCFALELNVIEAVPEWDSQDVWFMLEETTVYTGGKLQFVGAGRDRIYLI
ncbi:Xaa-Pro aminopeptidase [Spirochaetia bacterium]|nr:Xaa-Pro aminopeptidase [Spirochaetia bacterium]